MMSDQNLDYLTPEQRDWWLAHADTEPTLILRCGIDGCGKSVGEVKTDETDPGIAIALIYAKFGERTVPYTPYTRSGLDWAQEVRDASGKSLADIIKSRIDELDSETLRYVGDDQRVAKRYTAPPTAVPLDLIGFIRCPVHGTVGLPDPAGTIGDMRAKLATTGHASKRGYVMFRGNLR
jgi:hypothetical protein